MRILEAKFKPMDGNQHKRPIWKTIFLSRTAGIGKEPFICGNIFRELAVEDGLRQASVKIVDVVLAKIPTGVAS